jgi:hypothetical protein
MPSLVTTAVNSQVIEYIRVCQAISSLASRLLSLQEKLVN